MKVANDIIFEIIATKDGIVDLTGKNTWLPCNTIPLVSQDKTIISQYSIYIPKDQPGYGLMVQTNDERMLLTPTDRWTFSAWIMPLNANGRFGYATLFNGNRARRYQRLSVFYENDPNRNIYYSHQSSTVYEHSEKPLPAYEIMDGNWHHVAFTHDDNSMIYTFYDGELIKTEQETEDIDWRQMRVLVEGNGDNNSWSTGYYDDITFIKGRTLWTEDFEPPTYLIGKPSSVILNNMKC